MISNNIYIKSSQDETLASKKRQKVPFSRDHSQVLYLWTQYIWYVTPYLQIEAHIHPILLEQTRASAFHAWLWTPSTNTAAKKEGPAK